MGTSDFFNGFDKSSPKAWKQNIQADLQGADYNETLIWESPEGIHVKPFYTSEDLPASMGGPSSLIFPFKIGHIFTDAEQVTLKLKSYIDTGIEVPVLKIDQLKEHQLNWNEVFHGTENRIFIKPGYLNPDLLQELKKIKESTSAPLHLLYDPISHLAETGNWMSGMNEDLANLKDLFRNDTFSSILSVDTSLYQEAGANRVQELGYALAHAHEYLVTLDDENLLTKHNPLLVFEVAMGSDYFFEIAKLRALRILWEQLAGNYGIEGKSLIVARPGIRNKTLYDYNTNMLRTTTECMSAAIGGADVICNLPYDHLYHHPNDFGDRIARNQLIILKSESYFNAVENPADGAYYIESLTEQLGNKALSLFKTIEKGGGFLKQLKAHKIQAKIRHSAEAEQADFSKAEKVLIGTNVFPNPGDTMKATLEKDPFARTRPVKTLLEPILRKRLATQNELKRLGNE